MKWYTSSKFEFVKAKGGMRREKKGNWLMNQFLTVVSLLVIFLSIGHPTWALDPDEVNANQGLRQPQAVDPFRDQNQQFVNQMDNAVNDNGSQEYIAFAPQQPQQSTSLLPISFFTDLNKDGEVNIIDLVMAAKNFGSSGVGDVDNNGVVEESDLQEIADQFGEDVVAQLETKLQEGNVGTAVVLALGSIQNKRVIPILVETLGHESFLFRLNAQITLSNLGFHQEAIDQVISALAHENAEVRYGASQILGDLKAAEATEELMTILASDPIAKVREVAAEALGEIGALRAMPVLIQAMGNRSAVLSYEIGFSGNNIRSIEFNIRREYLPEEAYGKEINITLYDSNGQEVASTTAQLDENWGYVISFSDLDIEAKSAIFGLDPDKPDHFELKIGYTDGDGLLKEIETTKINVRQPHPLEFTIEIFGVERMTRRPVYEPWISAAEAIRKIAAINSDNREQVVVSLFQELGNDNPAIRQGAIRLLFSIAAFSDFRDLFLERLLEIAQHDTSPLVRKEAEDALEAILK